MQFSTLIVAASVLVSSVLAGYNCKCQDESGQYDYATENCCALVGPWDRVYHPDQHHQCTSASGSLDSGRFVECCKGLGHGGAHCWK